MEIYKTKEAAEAAKKNNSDMVVKVESGFAIMTAREYIDWLVKQ